MPVGLHGKAVKAAQRFESARDSARNRLSRDYLTNNCRPFSPIRTECRWEYINHVTPLITKLVGLIGEQVRGNLAANAGGTTW